MRVRFSLAALLSILTASPALADKPEITLVGASPAAQSEACSAQKGKDCKVYLGPNSEHITITWKSNHGSDKARYYVEVTDGTCDDNEAKRYQDVAKSNYPTKDAELTFQLKRESVANLLSGKPAAATERPPISFKLCFEAGEHTNDSQVTGASNQTGGTTSATDANHEIPITVAYDENPPKLQTEALDVSGLNKAIRINWQASESGDVAKYRIFVDDRCQKDIHDKQKDALVTAIQANYTGERQQKLRQNLETKCNDPTTEDSQDSVEVDAAETTAVLTKFKGEELREDTVYFLKLYAVDRANNEGGPAPGIGIPVPAIGPKDIFPGDNGCSTMPGSGGPGDWSWLILVPVLLARRRKP
ncbi:MAG: hypothetical protein HYT87_15845 [Nitrospirae bacterium]|nr:hypothetical protein [Nitrospirota bacterium]